MLVVKVLSEKELKSKNAKDSSGAKVRPKKSIVVPDPHVELLKEILCELKKTTTSSVINTNAIKVLSGVLLKLDIPKEPVIIKEEEEKEDEAPKKWDMDVVRNDEGFISSIKVREAG